MRLTKKTHTGYTYRNDADLSQFASAQIGLIKLGQLEDFEEELEIELIPFLSQLIEAMAQLKKNGLKFKAVNFQAKGKKYKLEELQ